MRALYDPGPDAVADEEEVAAFRRGFAAISEDHKRVLAVLVPRLAALQERGDSEAALRLIAEIKRIVVGGTAALH